MRSGWLTETMMAKNLCAYLRMTLFFNILEEARKGPGRTDTNVMMDSMDGREWLARASRALERSLDKESKTTMTLQPSDSGGGSWALKGN